MYSFNPFRKYLAKVEGRDLLLLLDIAEGWYVDYKKESIKTKDIAKHISAFSNQYGGYLFFGVIEKADGSRKAGAFPGLPSEEVSSLSVNVREAAVAHSSPPIFYEEHIINGPSNEIGLPENRSILIIGIPQGDNPPYIHSSGRIYRRLADQSKPKEETDRYVLDALWNRGRENRRHIYHFLRNTPELPSRQTESVWAFVHVMPDINYPTNMKPLTFEQFQSYTVQSKNNMLGPTMPMQSIFSKQDGFIARQVENNDPGLANPSLRWWHLGAARFDIPLNTWTIDAFYENASEYKYASHFCSECRQQGFTDTRICDVSYLIVSIASLLNCYFTLRKAIADTRPVYATYELRNVFYTLPFVDSQQYIERCANNGIPVIQDKVILLSEEPYFDNMISLFDSENPDDKLDDHNNHVIPFVYASPIAYSILNSIGALWDIPQMVEDNEIWGYHKMKNS